MADRPMGIVALEAGPPDAVLAFLDTVVSPRDRAHWHWKYPPAGPATPRGFYNVAGDETVTGFVGLLPTTLFLPGGPVPVAWIVDWVAAGDAVGVGLALLRRAEKAVPLHFVFGASQVARDIYARLRWKHDLAAKVFVLPLTARDLARRGPARRPGLAPLVRVGAHVARHWWRVSRPGAGPVTLRETARVPAEYDAVFAERCAEFAPVIDRRSDALNARCVDFPGGGYRLFVVEQAGRPVGHLVTRIDDDVDGVRRGRIVDLLWPRREPGVVEWLVHEAAWRLQAEGADFVECIASVSDLEAALRARRFFHRSTLPVFYRELSPAVPPPARWFITAFDADRAYR